MSNAAAILPQRFDETVLAIETSSALVLTTESYDSDTASRISLEIILLGLSLSLLQILDGVLTGIGVGQFGVWAEGNYVVRSLMQQVGHIPALLVVKAIAIAAVGGLCYLAPRVSWMGRALKSLIVVYLVFAVVPWSIIIIRHMFFAAVL